MPNVQTDLNRIQHATKAARLRLRDSRLGVNTEQGGYRIVIVEIGPNRPTVISQVAGPFNADGVIAALNALGV